MTEGSQIRILQVVGGMNRGGVETWLMHVLRRMDRDRLRMDFLVHTGAPCAFDSEIHALGSSVIPCLRPSEPRTYARAFRRILSDRAPYDVIHSHVHHFSGFVLRLAKQAGVPLRIAHSHNVSTSVNARADLQRRFYLALMRRWIDGNATHGLAASRQAATALFGQRWDADPRYRILHCSIDLDPFRRSVDRGAMRAALGIPADSFVVGHVARFDPVKNHHFLIDVSMEIARHDPRFRLVLVGDGPLQAAIRARVRDAGLEDRVLFLGVRADVAELMRTAFDVLLLPSLQEGLSLVLLEAQASGLPCVLTASLPHEVAVVPRLMHKLSLEEPAAVWARAALAARTAALSPDICLALVEKSPFNIEYGLAALEDVYSTVGRGDAGVAIAALA